MLVINLLGLFAFFMFKVITSCCSASFFGNISILILDHYIYFMPTLIVLCILKQRPLSLSNVLFTLTTYFSIWYTIQSFLSEICIQKKLVKFISICANNIEAIFNDYLVHYTVLMSGNSSNSDSLPEGSNTSSNRGGSPNPDGDITINDNNSEDEGEENYHDPTTLLMDDKGTINYEAIQTNVAKEHLNRKVSIKTLENLGFVNKDGRLGMPKQINATDLDKSNLSARFTKEGVLKRNYINVDGTYAIPTNNMNSIMRSINHNITGSSGKLGDISNITLDRDLLDPTLNKQIKTINQTSNDESETVGLWNMVMGKIFLSKDGYIYGPENKSGKGRVDGLIKWSDPSHDVIDWYALAHVEYKSPQGDPLWFLIGQAQNYAEHSKYTEGSFAICVKGTLIGFFVYSPDFHSSILNFNNKGTSFDGMLGLYVNNKGVRILPQYDTYYPQTLFYDINGNKDNKISIVAILGYMSTLSTSNTVDYVDNKIKFKTGSSNLSHKSYLLGKINQERIKINAKGDFY